MCCKLQILHCAGVAACGAAEDAGGGGAAGGDAGEMHGGAQAAVEGGERDGRDELMCGSCSAKACGMEASCPRHSDQYVEFKCRFCCSIATFFCFGHTHFCEKCHLKVSVAPCADCFTLRERGGGGASGLAATARHPKFGILVGGRVCWGVSGADLPRSCQPGLVYAQITRKPPIHLKNRVFSCDLCLDEWRGNWRKRGVIATG